MLTELAELRICNTVAIFLYTQKWSIIQLFLLHFLNIIWHKSVFDSKLFLQPDHQQKNRLLKFLLWCFCAAALFVHIEAHTYHSLLVLPVFWSNFMVIAVTVESLILFCVGTIHCLTIYIDYSFFFTRLHPLPAF